MKCRAALSKSRLPGLVYSLNPYFGCEHNCIYCYSPSVFRSETVAQNWGKFVKAKKNIPEVLMTEIQRFETGTVGVSTVTDPYQPAESNFKLTRKCLEILSKNRFPISIQTKSDLVLRDVDIIKSTGSEVGVTLTTLNEDVARKIEPNASRPDRRIQILEEFHSRQVKTWIFLGPIIPEINDDSENIAGILDVARRTKSKVLFDKLNLKMWVLERMRPTVEQFKPDLITRITDLVKADSNWWQTVSSNIGARSKEESVVADPAFP
jgi:DNA repair photolyase